MIPESYANFFLGIAGASAGLIGLLFVAISVSPERVVGPNALVLHQIRATMALTTFASTLTLALIALLPDAHLGWPAAVVGLGGAAFVARSLPQLRSVEAIRTRRRGVVVLAVFLLVMGYLASSGIRLVVDPHATDAVSSLTTALIALIVIGIDRSWELVGGRSSGIGSLVTNHFIGDEPEN